MTKVPAESRVAEYAGERDMERFWQEIKPQREPMQRRFFLPLILLLIAVSVPWYLPTGMMGRLVGGLPIWMWTALASSLGISAVTAFVCLFSWEDDQ